MPKWVFPTAFGNMCYTANPVQLASIPGVDSVELRGDTILLACSDSDAVLRALLTATTAHDIEVTARNLEDAFLALTAGAAQ